MRRSHRLTFVCALLAVFSGWSVGIAGVLAQTPGTRAAGRSRDVTLETRDGVALKATFYPSSLGQKAVPIVMLHGEKESRAVFSKLARQLQTPSRGGRASYAVLTVDLRGHGESTRMIARNGQTRTIEADRLRAVDYRNMVLQDLEAVRRFLVKKNDAGELNLNKLCLIGAGLGANVATAYAAYDWSVPQLAQRKQGQDVKALILVSPKWNAYGLSLRNPLRQEGVRKKLSIMLVYGAQDSRATKDAKTIYKNIAKYHLDPREIPRDQLREKQDLFMVALPTRLQGSKLLTDPDFKMLGRLYAFLDARLSSQNFDWIPRKRRD